MVISKGLIAFVLGSAFVSSAIVYQGIANRHREVAAASNPATEQQPATPKPDAGTPATDAAQTSNPKETNAQQSADGSADPIAQQNQDASADQSAVADQNQNGTAASVANDQQVAEASDQQTSPAVVATVRSPVAVARGSRAVAVVPRSVAAHTTRVVRARETAARHVHHVVSAWAVRVRRRVCSEQTARWARIALSLAVR